MVGVDTDCLRPGVDGAGDDRGADRQPGAGRGLLVDGPGHFGGPTQRRHLELGGDPLHPRRIPVPGMGVIQRRGLARRLMVENVDPGQAVCQPAAGHEQPASAGEHLRLFLRDPLELGTDSLSGQSRAAACQHLVASQLGVQRLDLRRGPGVDPVQDGRPQRRHVLVRDQDTGTHAAHPHGRHLLRCRSDQVSHDGDALLPPDVGVHLDPPRMGPRHLVRADGLAQHLSGRVDQHALAARRPDVYTDEQRHCHSWLSGPPRTLRKWVAGVERAADSSVSSWKRSKREL